MNLYEKKHGFRACSVLCKKAGLLPLSAAAHNKSITYESFIVCFITFCKRGVAGR